MSTNSSLLKNAAGLAAAFGAADITTPAMRNAISKWFDLYYKSGPTADADPCQRIPYTIVRKLTKTTFSEYKAVAESEFLQSVLRGIADIRTEAMQLALIGGEALLKPIPAPDNDGFLWAAVPRNNILVFGRDPRGEITDVGTLEVTTRGNCYYTLLERRRVDENGYLNIRYSLYKSYAKETLGQQVPLNHLPQYEQLEPEYTYSKLIGSVGMVRLKTPMVNCVDGSPDGVSVYAPAEGLIQNIDRNEAQLNGEFERGESRVFVSSDLLSKDAEGNKGLHHNLFVGLDEDPETAGVTIFSPQLREASFLARKQEYLRNVENVIGLKRGLLSEVEAAERTATEITSSAGEYNLTILDFQNTWERAVKEAAALCGVLGQMYKIAGAHDVKDDDITFEWGNGVLYDEAKTYGELKEMVAQGLLQPERLVGWYHNVPCDTPEEREQVREKYMPLATEE